MEDVVIKGNLIVVNNLNDGQKEALLRLGAKINMTLEELIKLMNG
jgi:hypothetical protein